MAKKQTEQSPVGAIALAFVIAAILLILLVAAVQKGPGQTATKASRNDFLTTGDDALSLQQDLQRLGEDPGAAAEAQLQEVQ